MNRELPVGVAVVGVVLTAVNTVELVPYLSWSKLAWYALAFLAALWLGYMLKDARRAILAGLAALIVSAALTFIVYFYPGAVGVVELWQPLEHLAFIEAGKRTLIDALPVLLGSAIGAMLAS